jgi:hypothetical protein
MILSSWSSSSAVFPMASGIINNGVRNGQANRKWSPQIDLKTAKTLGLTIPRNVSVRADRVIR